MAKLQLHFNGSFAFKKEEISRILQAASEENGLNDTLPNLMQKTSLGNAKVGRIKSWTIRAGLIQNHRLTPEGEIVWRRDPNLESSVTEWLMHFYLSFGGQGIQPTPKSPEDWGGWCYFVYSFLPENSKFTSEEFLDSCTAVFEEESKVIADRIKFIFRTYTDSQALASCKFLTQENKKYVTGYARLPNPYLVGYFLALLWQRDFQEEGSVLTESILNQKMGLAAVLGVKATTLQEQLNALEAYGIIEQRRTVPPFQVIRRWDEPLVLLQKSYDSES
ncbi:hypothetical protein NIES592_18560 [Fischerella major NIES-592]|uniref:DUF4007 domain-containing protein n=1 Tax=Fischerella major NIES-592 TaxID=210994 RepID=A0A1U7GVL1_9CYAN|nr:DUF4007 family protein [Fischerella major]OKH12216.1 hypothetical protein NIES592_18560 [Fischerella major NIES-592]